MRYNDTENTVLAGMFSANDIVSIKVINMETDILEVLTSNVCTESTNIPGVFLWDMSNITTIGYKNFLYEMSNGTKSFYGKFIYGGTIDANIEEVSSMPINSIEEFKADISDIPFEVWNYVQRVLTEDVGLTPPQEQKLDQILLDIEAESKKIKNTIVAVS